MNASLISGIAKVVATLGVGGMLAGAIALGATNGRGTTTPSAQVVAETPTSIAEVKATEQRPEQIVPTPTPPSQDMQSLEPLLASQEGRSDCPNGWLIWRDTKDRFSICYPPILPGGLEALTYANSSESTDRVLWLHTPSTTNRDTSPVVVSLTVATQKVPALSKGGTCVGLAPGQSSANPVKEFLYQNRPTLLCEADGQDFIQSRVGQISIVVLQVSLEELDAGSYLVIAAHYHSGQGKQESRDALDSILETLEIN